VFCAGGWSDRLAVAAGGDPSPRIVPFRGAYLKLRPEADHLVRGLIYPVPDPGLPFLGVHLTRHVSGEVWLGRPPCSSARATRTPCAASAPATCATRPTWPGTWRMLRRWWRPGARAALRDEPAQRSSPRVRATCPS
jgi:2-hydroxyglutarate dehydrogenase